MGLDIFQLAEVERIKKIKKELTLREIMRHDRTRNFIGGCLYTAAYGDENDYKYFTEGNRYAGENLLERFCQGIFGASLEEVLNSYDKYLA